MFEHKLKQFCGGKLCEDYISIVCQLYPSDTIDLLYVHVTLYSLFKFFYPFFSCQLFLQTFSHKLHLNFILFSLWSTGYLCIFWGWKLKWQSLWCLKCFQHLHTAHCKKPQVSWSHVAICIVIGCQALRGQVLPNMGQSVKDTWEKNAAFRSNFFLIFKGQWRITLIPEIFWFAFCLSISTDTSADLTLSWLSERHLFLAC